MSFVNEDTAEYAAIEWLQSLGYSYLHGADIAPGEVNAERKDYSEVLLLDRLYAVLERINPGLPSSAIDEAVRRVSRPPHQNLVANNHALHRLLVEGVDVSYRQNGETRHGKVWLLDYHDLANNDWLAVNQFTVTDINPLTRVKANRRPDIVLFVNGLPLVVIELKNPADEKATLHHAFNQLQTYKEDIPSLMAYNAILVIADGTEARMGTLTSGWEWFKQWRTVDGKTLVSASHPELETLIKGALTPLHLLDLIRYFTVFEADKVGIRKKLAAYHQYHAVNRAVQETVRAADPATGDQRVGVVWHTQGSGKSLSMLFYAGKVIQSPAMENPTLVVLTDRNDLDDQLFDTFATGQELLRQEPVQAENRDHLKELLSRSASGGVYFTTIQKFRPEGHAAEFPLLSERHNIVFIADEAHRSQYGFDARLVQPNHDEAYISYGFAKFVRDALPNASFIGFTGTPIEADDVNTPQVFGNYIDVYDIQQAVDDGATVPIYYEARIAKLRLRDDQKLQLDPEFDQITESEEVSVREDLKTKWSQLEALVGSETRLQEIAGDIVQHFEARQEVMRGKGLIVCMSRRICVDLYEQLVTLRPDWHSDLDDEGAIKVVITGSASDPLPYQPHIRSKRRRKDIAERFKDPEDSLQLVIVCDMWLTGFDVPPLHTMYLDKPLHGHNLMQAIARVNRVFRDKPGGLIVDYLGIAADLKEAIQRYTQQGDGQPALPQQEAVAVLLTDFDVVRNLFHGFDYSAFFNGTPAERISLIPAAMDHLLALTDGKKRFLDAVTRLSKAFALAMPAEAAVNIRDEVAFFQAVRAAFNKLTPANGKSPADLDNAIKQIVSGAIISEGMVNVLDTVGLNSPDISILDDHFLAEIRNMPQRYLAIEV